MMYTHTIKYEEIGGYIYLIPRQKFDSQGK